MNTTWLAFLKKWSFLSASPDNVLFHLSDHGLIKISGKDAEKFLQGQLTCDVSSINALTHSLSAYCDPKGRILSLFTIFMYKDSYYLLLPTQMIALTLTALKKYAIFFKVELSDASDTLIIIGNMTDKTLVRREKTTLIQLEKNRYIIIGEIDAVQTIWEEQAPTASRQTTQEWHSLNIDNLLPNIYPETSGLFLPHELNLPARGAISFSKGCYTGQEIIARMHYKGKLKKKIVKTHIIHSTLPAPGVDIYYSKGAEKCVAGKVIDGSKEKGDSYKVLLVIDEAYANHSLFLDDESITNRA